MILISIEKICVVNIKTNKKQPYFLKLMFNNVIYISYV